MSASFIRDQIFTVALGWLVISTMIHSLATLA